jgi:ferritin-like metal-binding protein YciE
VAGKVSNSRDLLVQLLGEVLYVERRLADEVLETLAAGVTDAELRSALEAHRLETKEHVERAETAFRRLEVAASSHLSRPFESAVAQHDELASSIVEPRLADLFHAQAALHTEHWEQAAYRTLLRLAPAELRKLLQASHEDEEKAADLLVAAISRLADAH